MRRQRRGVLLVAAWLGALLPAAMATAQLLELTKIGGHFEVGADWRRQEFDSQASGRRSFDRNRYDERFGLQLAGNLASPRLLRFRLDGSFGLLQEDLSATGRGTSSDDGVLIEYAGQAHLFADRLVSFFLFGNRFDTSLNQNFGVDLDARGETLGATVRTTWSGFPSTFTWQRLRSEAVSRGGRVESRRDEVRKLLEFSGQRITDRLQARLRLRHEDVDDRSVPAVGDYRIREATGIVGWRWGSALEKSWRTSARFFERAGRFHSRNGAARTALRWDIGEALTTTLEHEIDRFDSEGFITVTNNLLFSLDHHLYESLDSRVGAFGNRSVRDDGERSDYGADLGLHYRKRVPWNSRLRIDASVRYRVRDDDLDAGQVQTNGEILPITDLVGNLLSATRIDTGTIEVFLGVDGPLLLEGVDYDIDVIGERVAIDIFSTGSVGVGDTLAVNYVSLVDPQAKTGTTDLRFGIGWDAGWLRLRYDHDQSRERLLNGQATLLLDSNRDTFRVDLQRSAGVLRASLGATYARDESTTVDFEEFALTQTLGVRLGSGLDFHLRLREARRDFARPSRRTDLLSAGSSLSWRFLREQRVQLFVNLRRFDDSVSPDQRDLDLGLRATFRFGRIQILPTLSWSRTQRDGNDTRDLQAGLRVRRSF